MPLDYDKFCTLIQRDPAVFWNIYQRLQKIRKEVDKIKEAPNSSLVSLFIALDEFHAHE